MTAPSRDSSARVLYRKEGRVAYITLNRPEALNALDSAAHAMLAEIWDDFEADDDVWIGVLGASGERAFCVGQDLKELVRRTEEEGAPISSFGSRGLPGWPRLTERFALGKPLIARVHGLALGGGFELALACDLIVASETAEFALPEARLGLIPGAGGAFRLTRQLPLKTAMGLLLTGNRLSAQEALTHGLVNEVVPTAQLDAAIQRWVQALLRCAPLSLRAIKQAVHQSAHLSLEEAFSASYPEEERRRASLDCREGPKAFAEKREPVWRGH
jgi:crotonobetainyl-CoA hydratase/dehydration protein DpgD